MWFINKCILLKSHKLISQTLFDIQELYLLHGKKHNNNNGNIELIIFKTDNIVDERNSTTISTPDCNLTRIFPPDCRSYQPKVIVQTQFWTAPSTHRQFLRLKYGGWFKDNYPERGQNVTIMTQGLIQPKI